MTLDLGMPDPVPLPSQAPGLSAGRRQTLRQVEALRAGRHPATGHALHPQAPPVDDRTAPGPRCGGCAHLYVKVHSRTWLKCEVHRSVGDGPDCRAWWPACARWEADQ